MSITTSPIIFLVPVITSKRILQIEFGSTMQYNFCKKMLLVLTSIISNIDHCSKGHVLGWVIWCIQH